MLAFFINRRKRYRLPDERSSPGDHASLVCLHHYDQVILYPKISTISQVHDLTRHAVEDVVASKWMLAFRLDGDASPEFEICDWSPLYSVMLLRLNRHLIASPTLDFESLAARYIAHHIPTSLKWALYRTFVPRELLLVLAGEVWNDLEQMQRRLERTALDLDNRILPAFDFVESWPCVRPQVWRAARLESNDVKIERILNEQVLGCRALRVHGNCQKVDGLRYECCRNLDRRVLEGPRSKKSEADPRGPLTSRRPITGVCQDREVDRPASTLRDLLCDIRLLREQCSNTDASCSVYLSRTALDAEEIHAHQNKAASPTDRPATGLSLDFLGGTTKAAQSIILGVIADTKESCRTTPLAAVRRAPGSSSIAYQLERTRDALLYSLNNTYVAPEFLDLAPYLRLVEQVEEEYAHEEGNPTEGDVGEARKAGLQAEARDVAQYLGEAIRERDRDDVSGLSHHGHSAPFSASGFSRLAAVGGFAVAKTLSRFTRGRDTKALVTPRLCVLAKDADYLELGRVPIVSAPIRSALEPYFYFGLGLAAGHVFWRVNSWATKHRVPNLEPPVGTKMSDRQHIANYHADSFCLNVVFCGDTERYLQAWVPHLLETLEREYMRVIYDSAGTVNRESLNDHLEGVAGRLITAAIVGYLQKGFPPAEASTSAVKLVRHCISEAIGDCPDKPCGIVARKLREFVEDFGGKASVLGSLVVLAEKVSISNKECKIEIALERKDCVDAWNRGEIVDQVIDHPLAALAWLRPSDPAHTAAEAHTKGPAASEWARNMAAILSVGIWQEMTSH